MKFSRLLDRDGRRNRLAKDRKGKERKRLIHVEKWLFLVLYTLIIIRASISDVDQFCYYSLVISLAIRVPRSHFLPFPSSFRVTPRHKCAYLRAFDDEKLDGCIRPQSSWLISKFRNRRSNRPSMDDHQALEASGKKLDSRFLYINLIDYNLISAVMIQSS